MTSCHDWGRVGHAFRPSSNVGHRFGSKLLSINLKSIRGIVALSLAALHASCYSSSSDAQYFLGEIELEISGETVKHSRAWKCENKTVFRPAQNELFEHMLKQVPSPAENFVVKRFGSDHAVLFDNWIGCGLERRRAGEWTQVTVFDSIASPSYGELLYLKAGAPVTVHNPFDNRFRTRLVRERVVEIDQPRYEASNAKSSNDGLDLLYQLRLRAAYGMTVEVLTWNETDKRGLREGIPLNNAVWEVRRLSAPEPKTTASHAQENPVHNSSLILLPLGYRGTDGKLSPPRETSVRYAGRVIELDQRGFAEIRRPEPGIKFVRFYAEIRTNIWASMCIAVPPPQCPRVPTVIR